MEEMSTVSGPLVFRELPKEQRKALQKEFNQTPEAKKMNRSILIVVVLFAVVMIAGAAVAVTAGHESFFTSFPVFLVCLLPAVLSQKKFEKWLMAEKNILIKKKRTKA